MLEFVPDTARLSEIFAQATAPTFFLGAVAGFISLMAARLSTVLDRARVLNAIPEGDHARTHLKSDLKGLKRRVHLLKGGIFSSLLGGLCATMLLAVLFVTEFLGFKYAYGAGWLFVFATALLGFALFRFAQETRISLTEADEYQ